MQRGFVFNKNIGELILSILKEALNFNFIQKKLYF